MNTFFFLFGIFLIVLGMSSLKEHPIAGLLIAGFGAGFLNIM